jgi:beta-barrel assembly-enhancing protease
MPRRRFLSWALLALLFAQTACGGLLAGAQWSARNRVHAEAGFNLFTPEQDVELGDASAEEIARQVSLLRDERTNAYVQRLGEKIAAAAPGYRFPYRFFVVASPEVNAFALPGGYVFINTGAIAAAHSEGELAGILAHEIAHVALRHGTNQASKAYVAKSGLNLLDAIAGGRRTRLCQAARAYARTLFLRFNREAEEQADLEGARLMAAAGYDPRDMASFFASLEERGGERSPEAEDDHPNPASRVALIEEALPSLQTGRAPVRDTEEFRRIQARLLGRR